MTTVPATATTTELGYLAEAIADHYRRNPTPAGAALDLAVVLASVLPPVQLNEITDALDTATLIAGAAAELEAAIAGERVAVPGGGITRQIHEAMLAGDLATANRLAAAYVDAQYPGGDHLNRITDAVGPRGYHADVVIVDEDPDSDVAYVAKGGRYRVTFDPGMRGEARIGRTYNVPPVEVVIVDNDLDVIRDAVYRVARPLLLSGDIDVHVNPGPTPNTGRVVILSGVQTGGLGTYQRIGDR